MTALTELSLAEAGQGLEAGDFTAEELTRACIEALERGRDLNAFITETPDIAVDRAKASDARRA
ncbi:MAG TPA: Asp-tRNA(Asn)/Glu-tRNA(Gln) amidotransferase subunit GatA, partial [Rhodospirillales bacterium]|nr:Asp-tRNA(Asn)/Glu-tRNA(Gln) amidotransferase subunit GatA [Rhodospirillales bacterium]